MCIPAEWPAPQFTICLTPSPNGWYVWPSQSTRYKISFSTGAQLQGNVSPCRLMLVIPVTLTISASSKPGTQSLATANTQPITTRDVPLGSDPIDKTDNPWTINYEFLAILLMQIVRIKGFHLPNCSQNSSRIQKMAKIFQWTISGDLNFISGLSVAD